MYQTKHIIMRSILFLLAVVSALGFQNPDTTISFTLRNNSMQSIPLRIPGVMNPNLSPMSNSGVSLEVGQEIYFFVKRKKYLLLTVTEEMEGQTIMVNEVIEDRKKELGI